MTNTYADIDLVAIAVVVLELRNSGSVPWSLVQKIGGIEVRAYGPEYAPYLLAHGMFTASSSAFRSGAATAGMRVSHVRLVNRFSPTPMVISELCWVLTKGAYRPPFNLAEMAVIAANIQRVC